MLVFKDFHERIKFHRCIHATFITLIPKVGCAMGFFKIMPISLVVA